MWTLVYAFVIGGYVFQYQIDGFDSYAACEYAATEILPVELTEVDNDEFRWTCV